MSKQQKLIYQQAFFFLIIFITFGLIIINEKKDSILLPKATKKIENYYNNKYKDNDLTLEKVKINNKNEYSAKVKSTKNNNYYFYITYKNRTITDTYKKDYIEGNSILKHIKEKLTKSINTKTKENFTVNIDNTLDKYTKTIQEIILKEDNLQELKIYNLSKDITTTWDYKTITQIINNTISICKNNNIKPKNYTFTITDKNDLTKTVEINNIQEDFLTDINNENYIKEILNNNSNLINNSIIEYKYLN